MDLNNRRFCFLLTRGRGPIPAVVLLTVVALCPGVLTHNEAVAGQIGTARRVTAKVELTGKLRLNGDGSGVTERPIQATGQLSYREYWLAMDAAGRPVQALRKVDEATASMQVGKWKTKPELPGEQRTLVAGWYGERLRIHSATTPLTQGELDVVDLQADPLALEQLLSRAQRDHLARSESLGTFELDNRVAAGLLRWDVVSQTSLKCKYIRHDSQRGVVLLEMSGESLGAVDGATCEAQVRGKLNYDPRLQAVTWADLRIDEQRAIGHAAPGLDVQARIRVQLSPADPLPAKEFAQWRESVPREPAPTAWYLAFRSERQGFELVHSPSWKLMVDGPTVTIFRLVRDGDLIAQANISRVADSERPTLAEFRRQVEQVLQGRVNRIVSAEQESRDDGSTVYRVVAAGAVEALPIQWMYVLVRSPAGHSVSCAITMDARLVERFAGADEELVASLRAVAPAPPSGAQANAGAADDTERRR